MEKKFSCQTDQCPFSLFDEKEKLGDILTVILSCPKLADSVESFEVDSVNDRAEIIYQNGEKQIFNNVPSKKLSSKKLQWLSGDILSKLSRALADRGSAPATCSFSSSPKCPHCGQNIKK